MGSGENLTLSLFRWADSLSCTLASLSIIWKLIRTSQTNSNNVKPRQGLGVSPNPRRSGRAEGLYTKEESKFEESKLVKYPTMNNADLPVTLGGGLLSDLQDIYAQATTMQKEPQNNERENNFEFSENTEHDDVETVIIEQNNNQLLLGDILLRIKHKGSFSNSLVCRIGFNTAFIEGPEMKYAIKDVDPVSIQGNDKFSEKFAITLVTEPYWNEWSPQTPLPDLWGGCKANMETEIERWETIRKILSFHKNTFEELLSFEAACEMHFKSPENNDYCEVLK